MALNDLKNTGLDQGAYAQKRSMRPRQNNAVNGDAMAQLFAALAQSINQRGQQSARNQDFQGDVAFGRHLGMDGQPIHESASPWAGPMKFTPPGEWTPRAGDGPIVMGGTPHDAMGLTQPGVFTAPPMDFTGPPTLDGAGRGAIKESLGMPSEVPIAQAGMTPYGPVASTRKPAAFRGPMWR